MAKYSTRAAVVGGVLLVVLDIFVGPNGGGFLIGGCILLGAAVIATALSKSP